MLHNSNYFFFIKRENACCSIDETSKNLHKKVSKISNMILKVNLGYLVGILKRTVRGGAFKQSQIYLTEYRP